MAAFSSICIVLMKVNTIGERSRKARLALLHSNCEDVCMGRDFETRLQVVLSGLVILSYSIKIWAANSFSLQEF